MSDEADAGPAQEPPAEPPTPAPLERSFVRMALWQNVLALVGIVVAVIALYAALTESAAVRQQTAASVWPFLQFSIEDHDSTAGARFEIHFANVGVGPAKVGQVQLLVQGRPVAGIEELLAAVGGAAAESLSRNYLSHRVVSPGEDVVFLATSDRELARQLQAVVEHPESAVRYCYCSIFDACWLIDSRVNLQHPQPVEHCPDYGDGAFRL